MQTRSHLERQPHDQPAATPLGALLVALVLAFGIFLLATGHSVVGWAMVCLAATGIARLGVTVAIRRQPLS